MKLFCADYFNTALEVSSTRPRGAAEDARHFVDVASCSNSGNLPLLLPLSPYWRNWDAGE